MEIQEQARTTDGKYDIQRYHAWTSRLRRRVGRRHSRSHSAIGGTAFDEVDSAIALSAFGTIRQNQFAITIVSTDQTQAEVELERILRTFFKV